MRKPGVAFLALLGSVLLVPRVSLAQWALVKDLDREPGTASAIAGAPQFLAASGAEIDIGFGSPGKGMHGSLRVSIDHGENWSLLPGTMPPVKSQKEYGYSIQCIARHGKSFIVGTDKIGILASPDEGRTWTECNTGLPQDANVRCLAVNGSELFAGLYRGGVFRSKDGGMTWTADNAGLPQDRVLCCLAVCGRNIVAGTDKFGIYFHAGADAGWTEAKTGLPHGPEAGAIRFVVPRGSDILAGGWPGVFLTKDGGMTWTAYSSGLPPDCRPQCMAAVGPDLFLGTYSHGVFTAKDKGPSWETADAGLPSGKGIDDLAFDGIYLIARSWREIWRLGLAAAASKPAVAKESFETYLSNASRALESRDFKNAIVFYSKVIELDPNGATAYLGRAQSYMELGTRDGYDKALTDAAKVVALDPGNKDIYPVRAEAWARKAEFALAERDRKRADEFLGKALADYEIALKEKPDSKDVLLRIGDLSMAKGDLDRALAAYSSVYEKDQYNIRLGDVIKSLFKDLERQNRPIDCGNAPRTWELAADFHYYGKRYDQALRCYDRALDLGLDPAEIWYTRSRVYADKGDFDKALADADKLMKSGRPSAIDYENRGEIYVKKGDLDKAVDDYTTAIKLQTKDLKSDVVWEGKVGPLMDLYESRAKVYAAKKDWGRAIDDLKFVEKRLTDAAAKAVINLEIAKVYQEKGDAKNAAIYLEKARALDPNIKR